MMAAALHPHCRPEKLPDPDHGRVERTVIDLDGISEDLVAVVQEKDQEMLLLQVLQPRDEQIGSVLGRAYNRSKRLTFYSQPPAQFDGGPETCGRAGPHAVNASDFFERCVAKTPGPIELCQQTLSDLKLILATDYDG